LYYKSSYNPGYEHLFIVRYGQDEDQYFVGAKNAAAEYYLNQETPLSIAYELAIEFGYIGEE